MDEWNIEEPKLGLPHIDNSLKVSLANMFLGAIKNIHLKG